MTSALLVSLLLGQVVELEPLRPPSADATLDYGRGEHGSRDMKPARESPLGDLVFRAPLIPGGTDALPAVITINGVSKEPICRYRAKDATATSWPAWGYGETLTKVEVGADTTDEDLPHLGRGEKGRKFNGADYYVAPTNAGCLLETEDVVVEVVFRLDNVPTNKVLAGDGAMVSATSWGVTHYTSGQPGVWLETGSAATEIVGSATAGALLHMLVGIDRNYASATYGARRYVNGVNATNADLSARSASADDPAGTFAVGSWDGALSTSSAIVYLAVWKQSDWFPGTAANATILDAIAADRSARFWGVREEVNGLAPTSRSAGPRCAWTPSNKLDCYSATAPITGADMPPGQGSLGNVDLGGGLLVQAQLPQPLLQSRALNTTWTAVGAGTVTTSTTTPFVDARQTYQVVDDDGAGEEYIYQDIDITALITGGKINVCPWAATESGTQLYTVTVTEQTGGSCTTTSTHYKPTATTSWALAPQTHTVLDGDCTSARIELRPYDVASGAAATGAVTAMMNAYPGINGYNGCPPIYVETTTAAVTPSHGALSYDVAYSAALGGRQVTDASSYVPGRRLWSGRFAVPYADLAINREPNGIDLVMGHGAGYLVYLNNARQLYVFDAGSKWACTNATAHNGFVNMSLSFDYSRDLYTTTYNGNTCQSGTVDSGLGSTAFPYFYIGNYISPASSAAITGMLIRDVEVYR